MPVYDVLVWGPIFCDLIFTGLPGFPVLGEELFADNLTVDIGGSAIVANGLQRLGMKAGLVADLGNDPISQLMWNLLEAEALDLTLIRRHAQPLIQLSAALSYPEDRAFITRFQHPREALKLDDLLKRHPCRHVHICSLLTALECTQAVQIAHAHGATISLDPGWDAVKLKDPRLLKMVRGLDFFMPGRSELCHMAESEDREYAARMLFNQMSQGCLIVKDGANGATAYVKPTREIIHTPAIPITPVETTGAGDAFDAGFLAAYLQGKSLSECMRLGAVCGGLTTTAPGGMIGFPELEEIETWLLKLPS